MSVDLWVDDERGHEVASSEGWNLIAQKLAGKYPAIAAIQTSQGYDYPAGQVPALKKELDRASEEPGLLTEEKEILTQLLEWLKNLK